MEDRRPPVRSKSACVEQHGLESRVGCDQAEWPDRTVDDYLWHLVNLERAAGAGREIPPTMATPALLAQLVEHLHGKEGVDGSSPSEGSAKFPLISPFRCSRRQSALALALVLGYIQPYGCRSGRR